MKVDAIMRIVLGLLLLVFGANRLLHFLPEPPWPPNASAFLQALDRTGFMFPLIAGSDVISGALLLVNRLVPVALVGALPVLLNALLFHVFLAPGTMLFAVLAFVLDVALIVRRRRGFQSLLAPGLGGTEALHMAEPTAVQ